MTTNKLAAGEMSVPMRAFERAAREYLQHPPAQWAVERIADRRWNVVDHSGARIATRSTEEAAHAAIDDSIERHIWDKNCAWYRGDNTDPRARQLTTNEKAIVAEILAEIHSTDRPSNE